MKQLFSFLFVLLMSMGVQAHHGEKGVTHDDHEEKGLFLGGAFTFWNNTDTKATTFQFFPEGGWRFNETWAAGLMLGYGLESEKQSGVREQTQVFKVAPFARYYYMHRGPFNLYVDGGVGYNHIKPKASETGVKRNGFEVGVRPGLCVDLAKGFCLCLRVGFAGYRKNYFSGEEAEIGTDGFGLRFAPEEVMIGLELEF